MRADREEEGKEDGRGTRKDREELHGQEKLQGAQLT